jgi:hypothetical protein
MHRVTEESIHRECEWKRSAKGETADALSATQEPPRRLDKQCLLMEVRNAKQLVSNPKYRPRGGMCRQ